MSVRERLAFGPDDLEHALAQLKNQPGVMEGVILSTCNRVEVAVAAEDTIDPQECVEAFLSSIKKLDRQGIQQYLYGFEGRDAIRHLFRVAASLDSMVVGEPQILGQMKSAYSVAKDHGAVSGLLDTVITRAFGVGKTGPHRNGHWCQRGIDQLCGRRACARDLRISETAARDADRRRQDVRIGSSASRTIGRTADPRDKSDRGSRTRTSEPRTGYHRSVRSISEPAEGSRYRHNFQRGERASSP